MSKKLLDERFNMTKVTSDTGELCVARYANGKTVWLVVPPGKPENAYFETREK